MKTEIADKKPDDFETTEQYLKYLNAQLVPKEEEEKPKWYQRIVNHVWNWGSNKK